MSIPIIVLYRARMRTSQKISLGIFLCLSLVMVCLAIIRASKVHGAVSIDVVWVFFWQYMETVVAVIMGSLTVVRNLLVHQTKSNHNSPAAPGGSGGRNPRAAYRMGLLRRHKEKNIDNSTRGLPEVPAPTLSGLRTFIRRNNRDPGLDTQATQASTLVQDETYYMAPSIEQSRIDPEEQGWEHHQHIYQVRFFTFRDALMLYRHLHDVADPASNTRPSMGLAARRLDNSTVHDNHLYQYYLERSGPLLALKIMFIVII